MAHSSFYSDSPGKRGEGEMGKGEMGKGGKGGNGERGKRGKGESEPFSDRYSFIRIQNHRKPRKSDGRDLTTKRTPSRFAAD